MKIKLKQSYETDDGAVHDTMEAASAHIIAIALESFIDRGSAKLAAEAMAMHPKLRSDVMSALGEMR